MTTVGICSEFKKNTHPGHFSSLAFLREWRDNHSRSSDGDACWLMPLKGCVCTLISVQHHQSSSSARAKGYTLGAHASTMDGWMDGWRFLRGWPGDKIPLQPQGLPYTEDCLAISRLTLAVGNWHFTLFTLPKNKFACSVFLAEESSRWLDADDVLF